MRSFITIWGPMLDDPRVETILSGLPGTVRRHDTPEPTLGERLERYKSAKQISEGAKHCGAQPSSPPSELQERI
ncbi:MAG: hypothetical protein JNM89_05820 [Hyphomicrobiaceae bacterium]|nr:hypothetical protein [Hyphomicrobiaceae bacterium]